MLISISQKLLEKLRHPAFDNTAFTQTTTTTTTESTPAFDINDYQTTTNYESTTTATTTDIDIDALLKQAQTQSTDAGFNITNLPALETTPAVDTTNFDFNNLQTSPVTDTGFDLANLTSTPATTQHYS